MYDAWSPCNAAVGFVGRDGFDARKGRKTKTRYPSSQTCRFGVMKKKSARKNQPRDVRTVSFRRVRVILDNARVAAEVTVQIYENRADRTDERNCYA